MATQVIRIRERTEECHIPLLSSELMKANSRSLTLLTFFNSFSIYLLMVLSTSIHTVFISLRSLCKRQARCCLSGIIP